MIRSETALIKTTVNLSGEMRERAGACAEWNGETLTSFVRRAVNREIYRTEREKRGDKKNDGE